MKVTKSIEKLMALTAIVAAFAMVGCEKTVEGMKEDTAIKEGCVQTLQTILKKLEENNEVLVKITAHTVTRAGLV